MTQRLSGGLPSTSPLADRLVTACHTGDLPSAQAAVADGASIEAVGKILVPGWHCTMDPLAAAVFNGHRAVVVWLLSLGTSPTRGQVMWFGAGNSTPDILQLLIDAGGDVNRKSGGLVPPLFTAVCERRKGDNVRVLLAQPCLDFTTTYQGQSAEQYARGWSDPAVVKSLKNEVSVGAGVFD